MKNVALALLVIFLALSITANVFLARQNQSLQITVAEQGAKLQMAKTVVEQQQSQIRTLAPEAARARAIPVEISTRKAVLGNGLVLMFKNTSGKVITVSVRCTNPAFNTSKDFRLDVDPTTPALLGYAQGWPAASGDVVEIACEGYDKAQFKIP